MTNDVPQRNCVSFFKEEVWKFEISIFPLCFDHFWSFLLFFNFRAACTDYCDSYDLFRYECDKVTRCKFTLDILFCAKDLVLVTKGWFIKGKTWTSPYTIRIPTFNLTFFDNSIFNNFNLFKIEILIELMICRSINNIFTVRVFTLIVLTFWWKIGTTQSHTNN